MLVFVVNIHIYFSYVKCDCVLSICILAAYFTQSFLEIEKQCIKIATTVILWACFPLITLSIVRFVYRALLRKRDYWAQPMF